MISEGTLEELKCASFDQEHFVIEPLYLINSGHCICKKCFEDYFKEIKYKLCGLVSKHDFSATKASKGTQKLLKIFLEDIFSIIKEETSFKLKELKGMLTIK